MGYDPANISPINNEPSFIMSTVQQSPTIYYNDQTDKIERHPPHFYPPKQPPPDRDKIKMGVGPTAEGFCAPQRVQGRDNIVCGTSEGANGATIYRERVC